jgi:hypothetical protein
MRKTFCDRNHQQECTSRIGRLHLSVIHQTNKGETVSEDEYRPMDLCGECVDELLSSFLSGLSPVPMMKADYPGEDAVRAEVPMTERAIVTEYPVRVRDE